jgi:hypothetical protein
VEPEHVPDVPRPAELGGLNLLTGHENVVGVPRLLSAFRFGRALDPEGVHGNRPGLDGKHEIGQALGGDEHGARQGPVAQEGKSSGAGRVFPSPDSFFPSLLSLFPDPLAFEPDPLSFEQDAAPLQTV